MSYGQAFRLSEVLFVVVFDDPPEVGLLLLSYLIHPDPGASQSHRPPQQTPSKDFRRHGFGDFVDESAVVNEGDCAVVGQLRQQ